MIHQTHAGRQPTTKRTPIRTYHPANAPQVTACVTFHDHKLGIVAHSVRSHLGVMAASTAIHWDAGVFNQLIADGCQWLECRIKDTGHTYRASVASMLEHGQQQQRFGLQWVLSLRYWSVDGEPAEAERQQPTAVAAKPEQPALFDLGNRLGAFR